MIENRASKRLEQAGLVSVSGEWWVRKQCVAMARSAFRHAVPVTQGKGWRQMLGGWKLQQRLFDLRRGAGMLMCGSMVPVEVDVTPDAPLQVRLTRLFAFEPGLEFRVKLVRRVPMSGAGAWQAAILSGSGKVIIGCVGQPVLHRLADDDIAETDFAPEAVVAWSPATAPRFALQRLTLANFLLPSGVKQVRMAFEGAVTLWLDGGSWGAGLPLNTGHTAATRPAKRTPPFG